jgi:hypothetical protein
MVSQRNTQTVPDFALRQICPYLIFCSLVIFSSFMGLGVLRLYSFRLECKLNNINSQIESFQAQQISLKQNLSALLSPGRVYGYSKKQLGMTFASNVKTLRLDSPLLADSSTALENEGAGTAKESEGWFYFFLEKAMAGD